MTKKNKRKGTSLEEALNRPWCYYCERDFDDLKILINHQRAKHYKCDRCQKRLNTAGGLAVHMTQVHKETLEAIENAIPGRESVDVEIFGMEGIPEPEMITHRNRIMAQVAQEEQDRRIQAGQPGSSKKPKIDKAALDPEEIKRRLAEHKKAIAEGSAQPGMQTDPHSPVGGTQSPAMNPAMNVVVQGNPPQQGFYSQPPPAQHQFAFSQPPSSIPNYPPAQGVPQYQQPQYSPQQGQFNGGYGGYPNGGFQPQPPNNMQLTPQQSSPPFGQPPYQPHHQPPPHHPPHNPHALPQSIPGLPPRPAGAPGLPPRPSFSAPPPPMKQTPSFHNPPSFPQHGNPQHGNPQHGQYGGPGPFSPSSGGYGFPPGLHTMPPAPQNNYNTPPSVSRSPLPAQAQQIAPSTAPHPAQVPDTSSSVPLPPTPVPVPPTPETPSEPKPETKKEEKVNGKKEQRLVWSDLEISPEEKRAMLPRYAFTPSVSQADPVSLGA